MVSVDSLLMDEVPKELANLIILSYDMEGLSLTWCCFNTINIFSKISNVLLDM